jgi:hypothetical protein
VKNDDEKEIKTNIEHYKKWQKILLGIFYINLQIMLILFIESRLVLVIEKMRNSLQQY